MRRFCIGDIHGGYKALLQVFEQVKFDYEQDLLVSLGDTQDGFPESKQVTEELMKIKNIVVIQSNHNEWFKYYIKTGLIEDVWYYQGGQATLQSYGCDYLIRSKHQVSIPQSHIDFLEREVPYHVLDNMLFIHGGLDLNQHDITKQSLTDLTWDRQFLDTARQHFLRHKNTKFLGYKHVFLGHTPTSVYKSEVPLFYCNVVALDTGGGWEGKLTMMNIDTLEYVQSDYVYKLYPNTKHARIGRKMSLER